MKGIAALINIFILLFLTMTEAYATNQTAVAASPIGYWKTIDDITGEPKSVLEISEKSGQLMGKVVKVILKPGEIPMKTCTACTDDRRNQRIMGMIVMRGLKATKTPGEWSAGEILDPRSGKTYHCSIQLMDKGQTLKVRGYLGISLFGRTQTWIRVQSKQ